MQEARLCRQQVGREQGPPSPPDWDAEAQVAALQVLLLARVLDALSWAQRDGGLGDMGWGQSGGKCQAVATFCHLLYKPGLITPPPAALKRAAVLLLKVPD